MLTRHREWLQETYGVSQQGLTNPKAVDEATVISVFNVLRRFWELSFSFYHPPVPV
jgi:hypothetical protein